MNTKTLYSLSITALLISGCAIGPDYERPENATPVSFRYNDSNTSALINKTWWSTFNDQHLNESIEQALLNNFDLLSADASVEAMLGKFDTAKSYLYPQFNANGGLTRKGVENATSYNLRDGVTSTYAANLSLVSYEIDLFGRVQRANEAVRAQLLATEYSRQTLLISIASSTAASYMKIASLKAQISLAKENIKASEEINTVNELKFRYGTIPQSTLLQSQAELHNSKATLTQLHAAKIAEEATFNLLLGRNPTDVLTSDLDQISYPEVPSYLPSEVLKKRPDVAYAEQNLISANAKVGIAMAGYYPSFKLTGLLGVQSLELSDLTSNPTKIWELAPSISVPIFTAGRVSGEIKTAEAEYNSTRAAYQKSIINALNDTDNAIGQNSTMSEQLHYQQERALAMKTAFEQSRMRYNAGTIAYNDLLIVQLQWLAAQQSYLLAKQNALISTVNLYKSLGGGWDETQTIPIPNKLPAGR
jgi:multidrug efflux system outer membrane protein